VSVSGPVSRHTRVTARGRVQRLVTLCVLALTVTGCASTKFEASGRTPGRCLCQRPGEQVAAIVLWGPQWRPDQKDVPLREAAAERGMERFFASSGCFTTAQVLRRVDGRPAMELSSADVHALAAAQPSAPSRALFVTVRELGLIVKLFSSPALVEGGTGVVLDIRSTIPATGESLGEFRAHWQNGGPWVLKGVTTLEQDIGSALQAALEPGGYHAAGG
jgi:hypothetical protein